MEYHHLTVVALGSTLLLVAACGESDPSMNGSSNAADAGNDVGAGGAIDAGNDVDAGADSGEACGPATCTTSSACKGIPYDHCGPIDTVCSCAITCLEGQDGGTNCTGGSPCKSSSEGTKFCSATAAY